MHSFLFPRHKFVEKDTFVDWDAQGLQVTGPFPAPGSLLQKKRSAPFSGLSLFQYSLKAFEALIVKNSGVTTAQEILSGRRTRFQPSGKQGGPGGVLETIGSSPLQILRRSGAAETSI